MEVCGVKVHEFFHETLCIWNMEKNHVFLKIKTSGVIKKFSSIKLIYLNLKRRDTFPF